MKKISILIITVVCLFVVNVKADMGPPSIAKHDVMVTNKDGAQCYEYKDNKYVKTKTIIPYKTILSVSIDISGSYITVESDNSEYNCDVKYSDVSAKTQSFSLSDEEVEKITPVKGIILAKGGLNMRKGPSVTYSKITTVPQYAIVNLTYKAGSYWYYCEYNDHKGWITGMDAYFGYDGKETLIYYEDMKIYSTYDKKAVIGKIPANTEITDYINLVNRADFGISHYVIYNGTKGYVDRMLYKTDGVGKIKLTKDYDIKEEDGTLIKKLTPQELEYNMITGTGTFYLPEKKIEAYIHKDYYEYVKKADVLVKTKGYIGEGLFGEEKQEKTDPTPTETKEEKDEEETENKTKKGMSTRDIIIICLLGGIFLALTAIVIIKLVNGKKKPVVVNHVEERNDIKEAREAIEKRINNEEKKENNKEV